MKKFLIGLMLSCVAMFSFSVVGSCMTQQTIKSAYLPIAPNSWFKSEVEQQAQNIHYIKNLSNGWYQKVITSSNSIVDKKPAGNPSIPVKAVLKKSKKVYLSIPIEDQYGFLGPQVASFYIKVKNDDINAESIEEILRLNEQRKPEEVLEAKLLNSFGAGTTYEEEIAMMEREVPAAQSTDKWEREPCLRIAELPFNLRTADLKIIPVNLNFGTLTCGYILTPSIDAPLEYAVIWFTHVHPRYERRQFYNLKNVLDTHWGIIEDRQEAIGICPA
ncbi:MAG: hypothetical protein LBI41_00655 [Lactobacillales bacterium]|nr:hypothetical protein [Lactobacillales bacterium]